MSDGNGSPHVDPYPVAERLMLTSALVSIQGGLQLLGAYATKVGDLSPNLGIACGHLVNASDHLARHLSITKSGTIPDHAERFLVGHFEFLAAERDRAEKERAERRMMN